MVLWCRSSFTAFVSLSFAMVSGLRASFPFDSLLALSPLFSAHLRRFDIDLNTLIGLETEGIFRVAGSKRAVSELAARIEKEGQAEPALAALSQSGISQNTVHVVAACLKRFLVRGPMKKRQR
jgi:hypothetical protein